MLPDGTLMSAVTLGRVFPTRGMGGSPPHYLKICLSPPPGKIPPPVDSPTKFLFPQ